MKNGKRLLKSVAVIISVIMLIMSVGATAFAYGETPAGYIEMLPENMSPSEYQDFIDNYGDVIAELYDGILNMKSTIDVYAYRVPVSMAHSLIGIIHHTLPEACYVSGYGYSRTSDNILYSVNVSYADSPEEMLRTFKETAAERYLTLIDDSMDDFTKAIVLHDALAINNYYPNLNKNGYNTGSNYTFMIDNWGVCQYYSECYAYLLAQCGIKSEIVNSNSMNHSWLKIQLDGSYYHADLTWDDIYPDRGGKAFHTYFLYSDSALPEHYGYTYFHSSDSTKYDGYSNLHDFSTQLCLIDGVFYGITSGGKLVTYDPETDNITVLKALNYKWSAGGNRFWVGNYSSLAAYDGKLYYNSPTTVFEYDPQTGDSEEFAKGESGKTLYGLRIINDKLWAVYADDPNGDEDALPPEYSYMRDMCVRRNVIISDGITRGTVTASCDSAFEGDTVTLEVVPNNGCIISGVWANNDMIEPTDGVYSFKMPSEDVFISASFDFEDGISSLAGCTVSLHDDIGVNLFMDLDEKVLSSDSAYILFNIPNGDSTVQITSDINEAEVREIDGKTFYVFNCGVSAKDMSSDITAQVIDGDIQGSVFTYSVKSYAEYLLSHPEVEEYAKASDMIKAMLNYGAYSQMFFNNNIDLLANASLNDDEKALGNITASTVGVSSFTSSLPEGVSFEGSTLSLKSQTVLSLYFKSDEELTFSSSTKTVTKIKSGGYQIARITGITAKELGDKFTLAVSAGENSGSVSYSPMNYCYNVLNKATYTSAHQDVVKALYVYWTKAKEYFNYEPVV